MAARPHKLKLVAPPTPLGDLSHIPPAERAGLIYQDGLRRLAEELMVREADALRLTFWVAGLGSGGFLLAFGANHIPWGFRSSWFGLLVDIAILIGLLAALLGALATLVFGLRWLGAMVRRRKVIHTLSNPPRQG